MAQQSPWAQIDGQQNMLPVPSASPVWAALPPDPHSGPVMPPAPVQKVGLTADPLQRIEGNEQNRLEADQRKDANPWGTPENHPGFGGKLAHVLSEAGNIAGDIAIPRVMANLPNTQLHRSLEEQGLKTGIEGAQTEEADNALKGAQGNEAQARADALNNPPAPEQKPDEWKLVPGMTAPEGQVVQTDAQGNLRLAQLPAGAKLSPKEETQLHDAFTEWMKDPKDYEAFQRMEAAAKGSAPAKNATSMQAYAAYRLLNEAYTRNPALLPILGPLLSKLLGGEGAGLPPDAASVLSNVPEDQPLSPETNKPIGTSMPEAPTGGTRSQAQTAARVITELPTVRKDISSLGGELGPTMGRWNEFLTGQVGAGDPRYEKLRTDMQFVNAAAAKFHLNSVRAVQEFNHLSSTGKMTPEVLNSYLDSVQDWAKTAQAQERGKGETAPPPPKAGDIVDGHKFNGGNPGDPKSWTAVK